MFSQCLNVDVYIELTCLDLQLGKCSEKIVIADKDVIATKRFYLPSYMVTMPLFKMSVTSRLDSLM